MTIIIIKEEEEEDEEINETLRQKINVRIKQ